MQGKILDYNDEFKRGLIRGNDGNKYRFSIDDCKSDIKPKANAEVDFEPSGDKAVEVYVMTKDTLEDVKDIASTAVNATANAAKASVEKSKKIIPIVFTLILVGSIVVGAIAFIVDQSEKRKYAKELEQEKQQIESAQNEYANLISRANHLMQSKDCSGAQNVLHDANQRLSENQNIIDTKSWIHEYDLAECYLDLNKPMKTLSIIGNPPSFDGDPNFWQQFIYDPSAKEGKARRYNIASKSFKLKGDIRSSKKYAQMACENGDCSLVEK